MATLSSSSIVQVKASDLLALPKAEYIMIVDAIDASLIPAIEACGSIQPAAGPGGKQVVTLRGADVRRHTISLPNRTEIDIIDTRGRVLLHDWMNDWETEWEEEE